MPTLDISNFSGGLDLRKGAAVSDANRLVQLENAFVTNGQALQKRYGLMLSATLPSGTVGLFAMDGRLNVFYSVGNPALPSPIIGRKLTPLVAGNEIDVFSMTYADSFNGFIYAAFRMVNNTVRHHYFDGAGNTNITDANCPHSPIVMKAASKLFSPSGNGQTLRFCRTGNPRDWSEINNAGFLPTGLNARGSREITALGLYRSNMVVLSRDNAQVWEVDPDPLKMRLSSVVENVGSRYANTVAGVGGDLYFLNDYGFRGLTTLMYTNNLADNDIGSAVDKIVRAEVLRGFASNAAPTSVYFYGSGQYMTWVNRQMLAYSFSRTSKISAWSRYTFPGLAGDSISHMAEAGGELFVRSGNKVLKFSEIRYTDDGVVYPVVIQLPYLDLKKPGRMKRLYGVDLVMEGSARVSVGWDSRDPTAFTAPVDVDGNTRPGELIPIECTGTEFSILITNSDDKPFRLDAVSIHFDDLGVF